MTTKSGGHVVTTNAQVIAAIKRKKEEEEKHNTMIIYSHSGVNALLNSEPGKMTLKQLQSAVVEQQKQMKKQEEEVQSTVNQGIKSQTVEVNGDGQPVEKSHPFDYTYASDIDDTFPGDSTQMKEMIFLRSVALYQQHERSLQINPTKHRIGQVLMSEEQRFDLEYARERRVADAKAAARAASRQQSSNVTSQDRVISVVGETSIQQPTFLIDESAAEPAKKRLLTRFLASVNKFVVRRRVDERLAAIRTHTQHQTRKKLKDQAAALQAAHPLSLESVQQEEEHLLRDFQLHTNNVQTVGYERGHDSVIRTEVELDPLPPAKQLVVFDEIIPFDSQLQSYPIVQTPIIPTYMSYDWLSHLRTGAWEESTLRGPRGELDEEKKQPEQTAAAATGGSISAPAPLLTVQTNLSSTTATLTSPIHTSAALLDTTQSTSKPYVPSTASKTTTTSSSSSTSTITAGIPSLPIPSLPRPSPPGGLPTQRIEMPHSFAVYHPIAQQHSIISASTLSVPSDLSSSLTETSWSYGQRSNFYEQPSSVAVVAASNPTITSPTSPVKRSKRDAPANRNRARHLFEFDSSSTILSTLTPPPPPPQPIEVVVTPDSSPYVTSTDTAAAAPSSIAATQRSSTNASPAISVTTTDINGVVTSPTSSTRAVGGGIGTMTSAVRGAASSSTSNRSLMNTAGGVSAGSTRSMVSGGGGIGSNRSTHTNASSTSSSNSVRPQQQMTIPSAVTATSNRSDQSI